MKPKNILICSVQVPFVYGGAELHVESLRDEMVKRGHRVDVIRLPFKDSPKDEIIKHALAWRLIDFRDAYDGGKIDIVIATKFPSYLVRHHNKVTWLFHQYRQAYDLYKTEYGWFTDSQKDNRVREMIINMDNTILPESKKIFTNSKNVASRLKRFNNIEGIPLYHPPPHYGRYRCDSYGDYILSVGRLERHKRIDCLIEAMKYVDVRLRCFIVGTGAEEKRLQGLINANSLENRIKLFGFVNDEKLIDLYANCCCVCYAPYDEDYGHVTLEAFLSEKPIITANDSGGVLEFVEDGVNGLVVNPEPQEIANAINKLSNNRSKCRGFGKEGFKKVKDISWDDVIDKLTSDSDINPEHVEWVDYTNLDKPKDNRELSVEENRELNLREIIEGKEILLSLPVHVGLDLIGRCDMKPPCVMCYATGGRFHEGLTLQDTEVIGKFVKSAGSFTNCSIGELLILPNLAEILKKFDAQYKPFLISSNGLALTKEMSESMIEQGLKLDIAFSLDAGTKETYSRLRCERFDEVVDNIRYLIKIKQKKGDEWPKIGLSFILMKETVNELREFLALAKNIEVDYVRIDGLNPIERNYCRRRGDFVFDYFSQLLSIEEIKGALREGKAFAQNLDLHFETRLEKKVPEPLTHKMRCVEPWKMLIIYENGETLGCCHMLRSLGDWRKEGLEALWNCKRMQQLRREIARYGLAEECRSSLLCPYGKRKL